MINFITKCGFLFSLFSFLFSCNKSTNSNSIETKFLEDSIKKISMENDYLKTLLVLNSPPNLIHMPVIETAYEISDTSNTKPIKIFNKSIKKTLVIRYTSIGCNSCSDLLFKTLNKSDKILKEYEILVLADYSDYLYFVKWYKIAEVNQKTLWLKKGDLPLSVEKENVSYVFILDENNKVSSIFIPNSLFSKQVSTYLNSLI